MRGLVLCSTRINDRIACIAKHARRNLTDHRWHGNTPRHTRPETSHFDVVGIIKSPSPSDRLQGSVHILN